MERLSILVVIGLTLDILGAVSLWLFGIPKLTNRTKGDFFKVKSSDPIEETTRLKKVYVYDILATIGIIFLIVGFIFQLVSNFV